MARASPWSRDVAERLAERGHAVHVIDAAPAGSDSYVTTADAFQAGALRDFSARVASEHRLDTRLERLRYLALAPRLRRLAAELRLDGLLALYGGGQALLAYASGVRPYAVYAVGSDVLMARGMARRIARRTLSKAAIVLANGGHLAARARAVAPDANVQPLLLGVDLDAFRPGSRDASPIRIVCTRGFLPVYNNELIVRALALMPADLPDYRLSFLSPGPLLPEVRALADRLLDPVTRARVEFLGGVARDELVARLSTAHVFVSVSRSDGTATSLLEALACGLYPILSDIPANREWVDDAGETGRLVPVDDVAGLATALAEALRSPERIDRARAAGRERVEQRASARANADRLHEHLEAMIQRSGAGR